MGDRNKQCEHVGRTRFLKILGGITVALLAVGVITQISDIRRYIKIATM